MSEDEDKVANTSEGLVPAHDGTIVSGLSGERTDSLRDEAGRMGNPTASISLIGHSPLLNIDGQPVTWFENWLAYQWKNDWRTKVWERMR